MLGDNRKLDSYLLNLLNVIREVQKLCMDDFPCSTEWFQQQLMTACGDAILQIYVLIQLHEYLK